MIGIISGLVGGLVVGALSPSAHAPANAPAMQASAPPAVRADDAAGPLDARWRPWLGCWQLWEEQLDPSAGDEVSESADLLDRTVICVRPARGGRGVSLTAVARDEVLVDRTLVADGVERDVREPDCTGRERNTWSADGRRLFTRAEIQCGDQPVRRAAGVSLLSTPATWVDIQVVEVGGRQLVEVRRYAPVSDAEQAARLGPPDSLGATPRDIQRARRASAAQPDLSAVLDASGKTSARAVEALLVETEPRLPLDRDALVALDDADIDGGVIDLLVALSYPDRFVVERRDRGGAWSSGGWGGFSGYHDPMWYSGHYYPYYVTPLGYYFWSRGYDPYLFGGLGSPFAVVSDGGRTEERGRPVPGVGYTRVSRRGWTDDGGSTSWIGRTASGGSSGGGTTSGGSSGGAVSRGGYSGGSSSGSGGTSTRSGGSSTGRRAVPRR